MNYSVRALSGFERNLKKLAKKYPSVRSDYSNLVQRLKTNPKQGTPLGRHCYKIRLAITSKGKGKSGGARVITHVAVSGNIVYLLAIYDKSEKGNLTDNELRGLLSSVPG